jgi:hypothetical protein
VLVDMCVESLVFIAVFKRRQGRLHTAILAWKRSWLFWMIGSECKYFCWRYCVSVEHVDGVHEGRVDAARTNMPWIALGLTF